MAGLPANDLDVRIGARIAAARKVAGVTQRQLGAAIGVSAAQFQKYEKGTNRLSASALPAVAATLGLPITAFFDDAREAEAA